MASTKTLAQLRSVTRELADQETSAPADAFVDNTELDARINEALQRLYDLLIQSRGQEYYLETWNDPLVVGQVEYALPADFYQLVGARVREGNIFYPIQTWEYQELSALINKAATGGVGLRDYRYRLQATNVRVFPQPTASTHFLYLDYIPAFTELVNDSDTFDGVNGWEKWAAYTAAIDIANKEENYELAQMLGQQRSMIQAQIEALAGERDASNAPRIQDTSPVYDDGPFSLFPYGYL